MEMGCLTMMVFDLFNINVKSEIRSLFFFLDLDDGVIASGVGGGYQWTKHIERKEFFPPKYEYNLPQQNVKRLTVDVY